MLNWFENHQPQSTQISTVAKAPFIQNSNQMACSVDCNHKFFECILSTPAIFKETSKLFGLQGCSDVKNWLDFSSIFFKICRFRSSILLSLYVFNPWEALWVKFDSGVIFLDQSQFFAVHSNQWDWFILYRKQITCQMAFFVLAEVGKGRLSSNWERFWNKKAVVAWLLLYKTNRIHVVVRLFSDGLQRTSKCGKNISDTLGYGLVAIITFFFLLHFDVICDLLLNRCTATWNLFVK